MQKNQLSVKGLQEFHTDFGFLHLTNDEIFYISKVQFNMFIPNQASKIIVRFSLLLPIFLKGLSNQIFSAVEDQSLKAFMV